MEKTTNFLPFKNIPTATGKYRLYFIDTTGKTKPVDGTGLSLQPFEPVAEFTNRKFIAIRKHTNNKPVLFLVSLRDGTIPATMPHGTFDIIFDTKNAALFFAPLYSNGKPAVAFSWCLPKANTPYQAINIPSITQPGIQSIHAATAVALPIKIDVIEIKPHQPKRKIKQTITDTQILKRKRGRPRGSKNKPKTLNIATLQTVPTTQKRPRGRPRGSKNKPKVITPIVPSKVNQDKQNRVSLHRTTKNILNPTYDVYINGRRGAKQRMNASAQTFMNKRILVVSYQVAAAMTAYHDVFLPDGTQWQTNQRNRYTNTPVSINSVAENQGILQLNLSNNNRVTISEATLKQFAPQYFVIENEKQR